MMLSASSRRWVGLTEVFEGGILCDDGIDFRFTCLNVAAFARLYNQGLVDKLHQHLSGQLGFTYLRVFGQGGFGFGNGFGKPAVGDDFVVGNGGNAV